MTTVPAGLTAALQDRYRLERELGRGGMATVYLARDVRHDREVALKVLRPELAAVLGRERFLSEIRLTARLDHPRILTLIDSGERDGYLWYVLPYVRGESLRHRLQRERQLGATDAVVIAGNVAGALEYAHQHGVIHRDVKPENILLHEGEAMLTDFGIALALHEAGGERLTESGLSIGTPQYMSPEQATAERRLDARTDVFSLGAVTYEMLAGEPPFTGATGQAVIAKLMTMPPTPLHTFREALPAELDAVIAKALAKVPADRYPTAAAFGSALQDAMGQSGGRAAAPPPRSASISVASPREELTSRTTHLIGRPAARRPPVWTWLAALGVVALATLLAFRLVQGGASAAPGDPRLLELYERARASYDLRTEAGTVEAYTRFSELVRQDSGYAAAWTGLAKTCARAYIRFFSLPGITRDSVLHLELAAVQRALALDPKRADAWVAQAMVSRDVDPTELTPVVRALDRALALDSMSGPAWNQLALTQAESGDFPGAMKAWHRTVAVAPGYAEGVSFLGLGYYWRRQFDSARVWADSALALEPTFLQPRQVIGLVAVERRDYAKAVAAFEAARRLGGGVEEINALAGRALAEARAGRIAEARATLRRAESLGSAFTPAPLHTAVFLAQAFAQLGETTRAMAWLTRYQPPADLHFQMHLRCDPPFAPLENDPRFRQMLLAPRPPAGTGC